jgi:hypothetical protein
MRDARFLDQNNGIIWASNPRTHLSAGTFKHLLVVADGATSRTPDPTSPAADGTTIVGGCSRNGGLPYSGGIQHARTPGIPSACNSGLEPSVGGFRFQKEKRILRGDAGRPRWATHPLRPMESTPGSDVESGYNAKERPHPLSYSDKRMQR